MPSSNNFIERTKVVAPPQVVQHFYQSSPQPLSEHVHKSDDQSPGEHYFCFGSNMNEGRMYDRGLRWYSRQLAVLPGHYLTFNKTPSHLPEPYTAGQTPGYANLIASNDNGVAVMGVLYYVHAGGLNKLDVFEGVAAEHYTRNQVTVYTAGKQPVTATTYLARGKACSDIGLVPSAEYRLHLLAGRDVLPPEYVKLIEAVPTTEHRLPAYLRQGLANLKQDDVSTLAADDEQPQNQQNSWQELIEKHHNVKKSDAN